MSCISIVPFSTSPGQSWSLDKMKLTNGHGNIPCFIGVQRSDQISIADVGVGAAQLIYETEVLH